MPLYQGYFNGNNQNAGYVDDTQYFSLAFTVNPGTVGTAAWNGTQVYNVPIYINIRDGIGDTYQSSLVLSITTD